ncbi:MAG: cupin-like domain-containing protein [Luteimonas sp.]|nr:cupin-like domain-containing protein [Luteimonas sp.]
MLGKCITPQRHAQLVSAGRHPSPAWLSLDAGEFQACYNRRPFLIRHRLAEHPLFTLDALRHLCRRLPRGQLHHRFGVVPVDTHFDSSLCRFKEGLTFEDALDHLQERQAYVCIYNAETDPEYLPVVEGLLAEIAAQSDPLDPVMTWYSSYIFISAHESVTPYHMDREMNFLMQVRGHKTVRLWDPADDGIMDPAQKDYLLSSQAADARPRYQPSFAEKAMVFELEPGLGVHHPFIAPHLVHTGAELSISFALTYRTRQSDTWTDAHRFNQRLRNLGLHPDAVGNHAWSDAVKAGMVRTARHARAALRVRH